MQAKDGVFELTKNAAVGAKPDARAEAEKLAAAVHMPTGYRLPVLESFAGKSLPANLTLQYERPLWFTNWA